MSKELVISTNRHETKVAILEDDQLVEIYFQRANEYSLAGSIHKGRVTRVLPGMQSAFVDLGLERDTFLYVSDFFEEHGEDFDAVDVKPTKGGQRSGGREDRGDRNRERDREAQGERGERSQDRESRGDREPRGDRETRGDREPRGDREFRDRDRDSRHRDVLPEREPREIASAPESIDLPGPVLVERSDAAAGEASEGEPTLDAGSEPRSGSQNDEQFDRRGRRSRRRRGRGRGFPESKYASASEAPRSGLSAEPESEPEETSAEPVEDVILLPGESLAKYRRAERLAKESSPREMNEAPAESRRAPLDTEAPLSAGEAQSVADRAGSLAEPTEEEIEEAEAESDPDSLGEPYPSAEETIEEHYVGGNASHAATFAEEMEAVREVMEEPEMPAPPPPSTQEGHRYKPDAELTQDIAEDSEQSITESIEDAVDTAYHNAGIDAEGEDGNTPPAAEGEGGENLSANVREQGGRFLQRSNRRMRRKMRGRDRDDKGREEKRDEPKLEVVPAPAQQEEQRSGPAPSRPDREKPVQPSISDLLKEGQEIIVQIAKEPLGQKGARITSHIALPGRYVVFMPTLEHLGVSRKISSDEERQRLKRVLQNNREGITGGFIIRTAGEGHTEQEIAADMSFLYNLWLDIRQKAERKPAPLLLHHDLSIVQRVLRDQLNEDFKAIWVDNEETYESTLRFMQRFQPALVNRVKLYTRPMPIFDSFGITNELEKALRPKVWLKSGGYIVINQTEALVAIDVNTGKYVGKSNRLEDTIVKTNLEAVKEIVRQVRLRDLGGIIVVDFIDMDERKNRQKVMQALEEAMRADRAPYKLLQFNDFGLVAVTRKRVKQSLERTLCSPCPTCEGSGYTKSVQTVVGEILQEAQKQRQVLQDENNIVLRCNPEVAKFVKSVENKYLEELEEILGKPVLVKSDGTIHPEKFDLA